MIDKKKSVDILRVFLYVLLAFIFFFTWAIRKDFIVGPVPAVIHMAIFWGLFVLIRKKVRVNTEEIKEGVTKSEKSVLKIILLFIGISMLAFVLAPLFF